MSRGPERRQTSITRIRYTLKLMGVMLGFYFLFFVIILLLFPLRDILREYGSILAAEAQGMKRLPELRKDLEVLERQIVALTTESIDARLTIIEKAIEVGEVKPEELVTLQAVRNEVDILKSYMFRDPDELVELKQLQRDYQDLRKNSESFMVKEDILREMAFLRNLFYATLAVFGVLATIIGGTWVYSLKRGKGLIQVPTIPTPTAQAEKREDEPADE